MAGLFAAGIRDAQRSGELASVRDSFMAYRTAGDQPDAPNALFLHGNPTSSYIWRNIIPTVGSRARCIAPDLIGFGQSGQPDIDYRFTQIAEYLDAFIDSLGITSAYLVAQDWGTAFAFHLAARRPELVRGLAFMEFIRPMPTWQDFHQSEQARTTFQALRTPDVGERMIFEENVFVERILPASINRTLDPVELDAYRAPFVARSSRRPTLQLPRELPIAGEPADVYRAMEEAHAALRAATYPKLLFVGDPGALVSPAQAETFAGRLHDCRVVQLGAGHHYLQEDHPEAIAQNVADWIAEHEAPSSERG